MPKIVATKEDWIKLGYELFSEAGENGLIVDKMSKKLQCNKSSFYWHFKTKAAFIKCLIEYWIEKDTHTIINTIRQEDTPKDQFIALVKLSFQKDAKLDFVFYLKKYAQSKKDIKHTIDQIDEERISFVSSLLEQMTYSKTSAKRKSAIFYKYLIGYHEMIRYKQQPRNYLSEVLKDLNQFINLDLKNE